MATFIPGITDVAPRPLDFRVDLQDLERSLMLNDAAYEQGARRVRSMYDSIFNSTLQRDDTTQKRDAYLKKISGALQSIATSDLSQIQNRDNAYKLFDPISSDPLFAKDLVFSRTLSSEYSKAMNFMNSSDPATRRQYWDTGMKALQYQAEEFRNASSSEALSMSSPRYVANIDFISMADKLYKDAGISVKQDIIKGGYIWTKKNGELAYPLTKSMVNSMFGTDPAVTQWLKTQAYVSRKDFVKENALKYGSEQMAEAAYFDMVMKRQAKDNQKIAVQDTEELKNLRIEKNSWDKTIRTKGLATVEEREKYMAVLEKIKAAEQAAAQSQGIVADNQITANQDVTSKRNAIDNIIAASKFSILSETLAQYMAMKNAETTAKVDPISLAQLRGSIQIGLENVRQANRVSLEGVKHGNRIKEINERGKFQNKSGGAAGFNWGNFFGGGNATANPNQYAIPFNTPTLPQSDVEEEDEDDEEPGIN